MRVRTLTALAAFTLLAGPVAAQDLSVSSFVGRSVPMQSLLVDTAGSAYFKFAAHTIYGLRLDKAMSTSFTLGLAAGGGNGELDIVSGGTPLLLPTSFYFIDARARLRLLGGDRADLGAVLGAGWTQWRMGLFDAANEGDPDTKLEGRMTGTIGLSLRSELTDRIALVIDATDRIHDQPLEAPGIAAGFNEILQHDLTFAIGLSFPLGQ
jgi:hypothetical protein